MYDTCRCTAVDKLLGCCVRFKITLTSFCDEPRRRNILPWEKGATVYWKALKKHQNSIPGVPNRPASTAHTERNIRSHKVGWYPFHLLIFTCFNCFTFFFNFPLYLHFDALHGSEFNGRFCLLWAALNMKGFCLWSSECSAEGCWEA